MDVSSSVVLWRLRRSPHFVSCSAEQVGEECFELRVVCGRELLRSESFEEITPLLARAEELRADYTGPPHDAPALHLRVKPQHR